MYVCVVTDHAIQKERSASPKQSTCCGLPCGAKQLFFWLADMQSSEVSGAEHCLAIEKRTHTILMQGLLILNLDKVSPEVELHLRRLPLLLAILATDPPKSSSL